jgi:hypothetical protein
MVRGAGGLHVPPLERCLMRPAPASHRSEPHTEPRWHASLAVVAAVALYITLPPRLTIGPIWVAPLLVLVLLIPLSFLGPRRRLGTRRIRVLGIALIAIVNFFNIASVLLLVDAFFHPVKSQAFSAPILLRYGVQIWLTNVLVFALWYWELDGNGPIARARMSCEEGIGRADFLFPQQQMLINAGSRLPWLREQWKPQFFDYVYVAFTNATAFSPTDVMPLSRWAKALMSVEALISLITVLIVLARSVSLIQ